MKLIEQFEQAYQGREAAVVMQSEYQNQTLGLNWQVVKQQVEALAQVFKDENIRVLGLYADNSPAWLLIDLAAQLAEVVLLPLPNFFSDKQLAHCLISSACDAVISDQQSMTKHFSRVLAGESSEQKIAYKALNVDYSDTLQQTLYLASNKAQTRQAEIPKGTEKITYTSGSTGEPKGVCLSSQAQLNVARSVSEALNINQPKHLVVLPLSTLLENVAGIYNSFLAGGTALLLPAKKLGFDGAEFFAERLLQVIRDAQPNTLIILPGMLPALVKAAEAGEDLPESLKFIAVGGAKVSASLLKRAQQAGLPVYEGYGYSECASVVSLNVPANNKSGSTGKPLGHVRLSFEQDEIVVSGNSFLGYVGQPESWYPTSVASGDIGELDADGYLHINGRKKNLLINAFGRNINPEWLESELQATGLINQSVVFAEAQSACVALIFAASHVSDMQLKETVADVNKQLPAYAQIKAWQRLSSPLDVSRGLLTATGKPKRNEIFSFYQSTLEPLFQQTEITEQVLEAS